MCIANLQVLGSKEYRERGEFMWSWYVVVSYYMALLASRILGDAE